jgi:hypothetical protein
MNQFKSILVATGLSPATNAAVGRSALWTNTTRAAAVRKARRTRDGVQHRLI